MRFFVGIGARSGLSTHDDYIPINAHPPVLLLGEESLPFPNMSSTVWVGLCAAGVAIATLGYVLFGPELWRSKGRALIQLTPCGVICATRRQRAVSGHVGCYCSSLCRTGEPGQHLLHECSVAGRHEYKYAR